MKKLHTEIIALCDYALIAQNNKPSIIGIFTELGVQQFPGGMFQAILFASLTGSANTLYKLTFKVKNEKGTEPFPPLEFENRTGANGRTFITLNIGNFVFPEPGEYMFSIYEGKEEIGNTTLQVFQTKQTGTTYEFKQSN